VTSALVVVALPQEAAHLRQRDVLVTGVGQAAAAAALAKRLAEGPLPGVVVNVGTAGSLDATYSAVLEIGYVTRHDFPYDAIAELAGADAVVRGYRLRSDRPPLPASSPPPGEVALATGDAFVNDAARPALTVTELGELSSGSVGIWVGEGSGGYFANLRVTPSR